MSTRPKSQFDDQKSQWKRSEVLTCIFLLAWRIFNAWNVQTFFQPDEYFQSLEPAWRSAFGSESGAWITWEWKEQLRSSIHPYIFTSLYSSHALIYDLLKFSKHDAAEALIVAPKNLQAVFAAMMDYFTFRLAGNVYERGTLSHWLVLGLSVMSPWQWFCSTRTFSNCLETTLTVVALATWPWAWFMHYESGGLRPLTELKPALRPNLKTGQLTPRLQAIPQEYQANAVDLPKSLSRCVVDIGPGSPTGLKRALTAAAIACILRPTNVVIWAAVSAVSLSMSQDMSKTTRFVTVAMKSGIQVLVVAVGMDWKYFGFFTVPAFKFVYFNIVQSLAVFYGRNRADYYLTEGLPLLLTTFLPLAIVGMWQSLKLDVTRADPGHVLEQRIRFCLAVAVLAAVISLSIVAHKEVRFIYPLLPMLHVLAAKPLVGACSALSLRKRTTVMSMLAAIIISLNMAIAIYVSLVHQRGVLDVMHYLRHQHESENPHMSSWWQMSALDTINITTIGFFMPCHSTPWRSHLVYPSIHAWALTCEPPIHIPLSERDQYLDEADQFYADPESWIILHMNEVEEISVDKHRSALTVGDSFLNDGGRRPWPHYLVFFEQLEPTLRDVLQGSAYRESWRGFNTHWHDDWRRQGDVVVWELYA
ncbi:glycosyltransferase family 22 protein [Polychaeton citri CBS 116435]|uniref:Mannosyltransferase n=1 Tax=Polychaeton citri CBS 116435 TaxID=1314669 RepID=A0A9P4QAZ4_9PEZI|nr:glycosyltransferase family 22 protein [Polychaeton citri CBS 116435]